MKKYVAGIITGLILAFSISVFAGNAANAFFTSDIKLKVNGQYKDATFVNVDGTNYCKVRDLVDAVGGTTSWDNATKTIIVETEVESMSTITDDIIMEPAPEVNKNPINTDEWVVLKDFAKQYNIKITASSKLLTISKGDIIIEMPMSKYPESGNGDIVLDTDYGTLRMKVINSTTYANISDLRAIGLID